VAAHRNIKNTFPGLLRNNQFHGLALPLVAFFIAAFSVCRSKKKKRGRERERENFALVWSEIAHFPYRLHRKPPPQAVK